MIHPSTGETLPESITVRGIELVPEGGRVPLDIAVRYSDGTRLWSLAIEDVLLRNHWRGRFRMFGFSFSTSVHVGWEGARDELEAILDQVRGEPRPLVRALGGNP